MQRAMDINACMQGPACGTANMPPKTRAAARGAGGAPVRAGQDPQLAAETKLCEEARSAAKHCETIFTSRAMGEDPITTKNVIEKIGSELLSAALAQAYQKADIMQGFKASMLVNMSVVFPGTGNDWKLYHDDVVKLYNGFCNEMNKQHRGRFGRKSRREYKFGENAAQYLLIVLEITGPTGKPRKVPVAYIQYYVSDALKGCYIHHLYVGNADWAREYTEFIGLKEHLPTDKEVSFEGMGLAGVLMQTVTVFAFLRGCRHFFLYVGRSADRAKNVYERMGFENVTAGADKALAPKKPRRTAPNPGSLAVQLYDRSQPVDHGLYWMHQAARYVAAVEGERIGDTEFNVSKLYIDIVQRDEDLIYYKREDGPVEKVMCKAVHDIMRSRQPTHPDIPSAQPEASADIDVLLNNVSDKNTGADSTEAAGSSGPSRPVTRRNQGPVNQKAQFMCAACGLPLSGHANAQGGAELAMAARFASALTF